MNRWYNNKWFILFIIVPFFKPVCFQYFSSLKALEIIFVVWKIVAALLIGMQLLKYIYSRSRISGLIIMVAVFELSIMLSTILRLGYFQRAVIDAVSMVAFVSFLTWSMEFNLRGMLSMLSKVLSVLMLINLLSEIFFHQGLPADLYYNNELNPLYFMAIDNGNALFLLFCMMVFTIEAYMSGEKAANRQFLLIVCCVISALVSNSKTAMGMVAVQAVLLALIYKNTGLKNIHWKQWWKIYSLAAAGIILLLQSQLLQALASSVTSGGAFLTGRPLLWSTAVDKIAQHFFIGYGRAAQDYIPAWGGYFSSHNFWLELLLQGGIIALILFVLTMFKCLQHQDSRQESKTVRCVIATFFVMMTSAMMESTVHSVYIFGTMAFLYYSQCFCSSPETAVCNAVSEKERKNFEGKTGDEQNRFDLVGPVLSVIVPIYNGEKYVDDLAASIAEQQLPDMELILVDDGSVDHTLERCRELENKIPWIKVIHTENKGVSHARNTGLEAARGQWIHFVDVDDRLAEGMYAAFVQTALMSEPDVIICGCSRIQMANGESTVCGPAEDRIVSKEDMPDFMEHMDMDRRYWLLDYIWNKWYRRDLIEKEGLSFRESLSLGEDFVFNTQYFQHVTEAALISGCYYQYLIRETGLVSRFRERPWEGREELYRAQVMLYQSLDLLDLGEEQIQLQAGQIAFGDIRMINSSQCHYNRKERSEFVRGMMNSSQYQWLLKYLKTRGEKSFVFRVYYQLFLTGRAGLVADVICLEKLVHNFLKMA